MHAVIFIKSFIMPFNQMYSTHLVIFISDDCIADMKPSFW